MTITYHDTMVQGSPEWIAARSGVLTASEIGLIISPTELKAANSDKCRAHMYELLAQRISGYVEPHYIGDEMLRGRDDEITARDLYSKNYAKVRDMGFITNDKWGFTLGYSPDGLVGQKGAIECKSRRQKFQIETIVNGKVPKEHVIQVQTGLLVGELEWIDFITYSGGLPMYTVRVEPDLAVQGAIITAATIFENNLKKAWATYAARTSDETQRLIPTERAKEEEFTDDDE